MEKEIEPLSEEDAINMDKEIGSIGEEHVMTVYGRYRVFVYLFNCNIDAMIKQAKKNVDEFGEEYNDDYQWALGMKEQLDNDSGLKEHIVRFVKSFEPDRVKNRNYSS